MIISKNSFMTLFFYLDPYHLWPGGIKFIIWGPRDPFQSPQIAIFNPETIQFSFASFSSEKGQLWLPKMFKWNQFFFGPTSLVARGHVSNTWNPQEPVQSLQRPMISLEKILFLKAALLYR